MLEFELRIFIFFGSQNSNRSLHILYIIHINCVKLIEFESDLYIIYPYLLILLSLNLIFSLHYLQQLYPKILALILHHICFSFLYNNREYFSKQKSNRYFNPYPYYFINFIRSAAT